MTDPDAVARVLAELDALLAGEDDDEVLCNGAGDAYRAGDSSNWIYLTVGHILTLRAALAAREQACDQLTQQLAAARADAEKAETFTRKYLTAIANIIGIESPIELIARAENNEENYADILLRILTERYAARAARAIADGVIKSERKRIGVVRLAASSPSPTDYADCPRCCHRPRGVGDPDRHAG